MANIKMPSYRTMLNSGALSIFPYGKQTARFSTSKIASRSVTIFTEDGAIKLLSSGECRKIRDCCIFKVNDLEVFL